MIRQSFTLQIFIEMFLRYIERLLAHVTGPRERTFFTATRHLGRGYFPTFDDSWVLLLQQVLPISIDNSW